MIGYIYKITNILNQKTYIGQTIQTDPKKRFANHIARAKFGSNDCPKLYQAIRKYGREHFTFEILDQIANADPQSLSRLESENINNFDSIQNGYNCHLSSSGRGCVSEETKHKISAKKKGKQFSQAHRQHLVDSHQHQARKVYQFDLQDQLICEFESVHAACRKVGCNKSTILGCIAGTAKTGYGFIWRYEEYIL